LSNKTYGAVALFKKLFGLENPYCPIKGPYFHDHVNASDGYYIRYNADFFKQPVGTTFLGFFQSFKYFESPDALQSGIIVISPAPMHSESNKLIALCSLLVRDLFIAPNSLRLNAQKYLEKVQQSLPRSMLGCCQLVCVSYPKKHEQL